MINLTSRQQEIVDCESKYCLVKASAGSGKTLVLTKRIEKLLGSLQRGEKILALTFTNKAARELRERLLDAYPEEELASKVFVGTIHSFCAEFVARRGNTIGLPYDLHVFEDVEDRLAIFADAVEAVPQVRVKVNDMRTLRQLFEDVGRAKRSRTFRSQFFKDTGNKMVFDEYRAEMLNQHAVDFDDILAYAAQILIEQPSLVTLYQRIYRYICIDEAQDLNDAQYQVIQALAGDECGIMMVGDSRQAIYGFNGSTVSIMMERFPKDYHPVIQFTLEENFRSSRAVMRFAQAIESSSQMTPKLAIEGEAQCLEFENEKEEAAWVVDKILELGMHGSAVAEMDEIPTNGCAVLARNRYVFSTVCEELDKKHIEYNERMANGSAATSESDLFKYFHTGLRLLVNPNDQLHLSWLNTEFSPERPYESFDEIRSSVGTYDGLTSEASDALRKAWDHLPGGLALRFDRALNVLREVCDHENSFSGDDDRLLAIKDAEQWTQWWERYCITSNPATRSLSGFLRALSLGEVLYGQKEGGVTLSTVHLAKGLEFDAVFVIGLNDGTFPDFRSRTDAQRDEERHSMFVAITRSKRLCYVTRPKVRTMPWGDLRVQTPSPFFDTLRAINV